LFSTAKKRVLTWKPERPPHPEMGPVAAVAMEEAAAAAEQVKEGVQVNEVS
jgi:hypothetical protein